MNGNPGSTTVWLNTMDRFETARAPLVFYRPDSDLVVRLNRQARKMTRYGDDDLPVSGERFFTAAGAGVLRDLYVRLSRAGESLLWGRYIPVCDCDGRETQYYASMRVAPEDREQNTPLALWMCLYEAMPKPEWDSLAYDTPGDQLALDTMRQGVWEYIARPNVFHYSHDMVDLFGPAGPSVGKPLADWTENIHPDDTSAIMRAYRSLLDHGISYRTRYRVRDRHGQWHWLFSIINAVFLDREERPFRVVGRHVDVTDIMSTEKEIAEAEERLRLIYEYAGIGIAVTDPHGVIRQVNPAFEAFSGYDRSTIVGRRLTDFAYPKDRDDIARQLRRVSQGVRREIIRDKRFVHSNGRVQWITITASMSSLNSDGENFCILMLEDVTERRLAELKLQYEANHDNLTGAWTRGVLLERLGQHLNLALRHRQAMSFCICDLDHFKLVNDLHGHQAGDEVLREFVKVLQQACRDTDVIGRYGGEEFGVVFPNTPVDGARHAAERARMLLSEKFFSGANGVVFQVTASFGITCASNSNTVSTIIAEADAALYAGKEAGRDRVVVYDKEEGQICFV